MAKPEIDGGRIPIELEGRECFLVPSLEACVEVAKNGLSVTVQKCELLDFETICMVIGSGLEVDGKRLSPTVRAKELPKSVYEAGLFNMKKAAIDFCRLIAHGGQFPDEDEEGEGEPDDPLP